VTAAELPAGKTKLSEFGFAEIGLAAPVVFAFRVTGTVRVVVPDRILIKPRWAPVVSAPAPTEAVITRGVVPDPGDTVSQPVSESAVTVTFSDPLAVDSRMVWDGVVTPVWVLNVSCCGVATTALA